MEGEKKTKRDLQMFLFKMDTISMVEGQALHFLQLSFNSL